MLIQLLSTMLLLATPAFGAGASNYNNNLSQYNSIHINAPASPKGAYFNTSSVSNYGTDQNKIYNYTSHPITFTPQGGTATIIQPNESIVGNYYNVSVETRSWLAIFKDGNPGNGAGQTTTTLTSSSTYWGWTGSLSNSYVWLFDAYTATLNITAQNAKVASYYYMQFTDTLQLEKADWKQPISYQFDVRLNEGYPTLKIEGLENYTLTQDTTNNYYRVEGKATGNKEVTAKGLLPLNQQLNEDIFDVVGDATTASAGIIGNGFNAMITLFYANGQVTGLGIICLILAGIGLVWFAWRLVSALFRRRA